MYVLWKMPVELMNWILGGVVYGQLREISTSCRRDLKNVLNERKGALKLTCHATRNHSI